MVPTSFVAGAGAAGAGAGVGWTGAPECARIGVTVMELVGNTVRSTAEATAAESGTAASIIGAAADRIGFGAGFGSGSTAGGNSLTLGLGGATVSTVSRTGGGAAAIAGGGEIGTGADTSDGGGGGGGVTDGAGADWTVTETSLAGDGLGRRAARATRPRKSLYDSFGSCSREFEVGCGCGGGVLVVAGTGGSGGGAEPLTDCEIPVCVRTVTGTEPFAVPVLMDVDCGGITGTGGSSFAFGLSFFFGGSFGFPGVEAATGVAGCWVAGGGGGALITVAIPIVV